MIDSFKEFVENQARTTKRMVDWEAEREQVITYVKRMLEHKFPSPDVCKFHAVCRGYRKEAHTCQHEQEAIWYCGYYKRHEAAVLQGEMKKMLANTDFGNFDV